MGDTFGAQNHEDGSDNDEQSELSQLLNDCDNHLKVLFDLINDYDRILPKGSYANHDTITDIIDAVAEIIGLIALQFSNVNTAHRHISINSTAITNVIYLYNKQIVDYIHAQYNVILSNIDKDDIEYLLKAALARNILFDNNKVSKDIIVNNVKQTFLFVVLRTFQNLTATV